MKQIYFRLLIVVFSLVTILIGCNSDTLKTTTINLSTPRVITNTLPPLATASEVTKSSTSQTPVIKIPNQISTILKSRLSINPSNLKMEVVAQGLFVPWSIVFTSPDRMLVTERNGTIREVIKNQLNPVPLITFSLVHSQQEAGLLGLALDPDYVHNQFLYACYTIVKNGQVINRVVRLKDLGSSIVQEAVIFDDIPAANIHAGGRIHFGPDGKLYITSGDATNKDLAQDKNSLAGKILRINADGSIPIDNPNSDSPVYSFGHRNPQGFDWNPANGLLYTTEHGPSGFDGPGGGDEINLIQPGGNYGWPLVSHTQLLNGTLPPLVEFTPAVAPAEGMFYRGSLFPQFTGNYFFGGLEGEGIYRLVISISDPYSITLIDKLNINVGRIREVVEAPDGSIYFTTSNRDGRGQLRSDDDKIYRITPQ